MPAILKVSTSMSAPTPDTPFQGTFKTSLCTLRQRRRERWYGLPAGQEVPERSRCAFPTV